MTRTIWTRIHQILDKTLPSREDPSTPSARTPAVNLIDDLEGDMGTESNGHVLENATISMFWQVVQIKVSFLMDLDKGVAVFSSALVVGLRERVEPGSTHKLQLQNAHLEQRIHRRRRMCHLLHSHPQ